MQIALVAVGNSLQVLLDGALAATCPDLNASRASGPNLEEARAALVMALVYPHLFERKDHAVIADFERGDPPSAYIAEKWKTKLAQHPQIREWQVCPMGFQ